MCCHPDVGDYPLDEAHEQPAHALGAAGRYRGYLLLRQAGAHEADVLLVVASGVQVGAALRTRHRVASLCQPHSPKLAHPSLVSQIAKTRRLPSLGAPAFDQPQNTIDAEPPKHTGRRHAILEPQ